MQFLTWIGSTFLQDQKIKLAFLVNNIDFVLEMYQQQKLNTNEDMAQLETDLEEYFDMFVELQILEAFR